MRCDLTWQQLTEENRRQPEGPGVQDFRAFFVWKPVAPARDFKKGEETDDSESALHPGLSHPRHALLLLRPRGSQVARSPTRSGAVRRQTDPARLGGVPPARGGGFPDRPS